MRSQGGFTFTDIVMGTAVTGMVVAGTMQAFVTAARIQRTQNGALYAEVATHAQDLLEGVRNHVAADDNFFRSHASFIIPPWPFWQSDDPGTDGDNNRNNDPFKRRYFVQQWDCDGDGIVTGVDQDPVTPGNQPEVDCYRVSVRVCWDEPAAQCPSP